MFALGTEAMPHSIAQWAIMGGLIVYWSLILGWLAGWKRGLRSWHRPVRPPKVQKDKITRDWRPLI